MKVLLIIHTPPPYGGGEVQALNLKGYFSKQKGYYIYDYSRKNHDRSSWNKLQIRTFFYGFIWLCKVYFLVLKIKPDKVYFTLPKSYFAFIRNALVLPLTILLKIKVYGELPGTSFLFLESPGTFAYNTGLFFLRRIDEIRFLSKKIAEAHIKYSFKHSIVIENGVSIPENKRISDTVFEKEYLPLIYVGAIETSKGIFNSLKAIKICTDNGVRVHFNIMGYWISDLEQKNALKYIEANCIQEHITFHGIKSGIEKWTIFSNNAILIHPTYWDGVPLTILEALALGLTVISTKVGGIPDTITSGTNGTILANNDPKELAEAIKFYYYHRESLKEISKKNQVHYKENYRVEIFLKNMERWFNN